MSEGNNNQKKGLEKSPQLLLKNEIIGIVLLFISVFFIFSVVSYTPSDPSFFNSTPDRSVENYGGRLGAQVAAVLYNLFGYASLILLFYLLFMTTYFFDLRLLFHPVQNLPSFPAVLPESKPHPRRYRVFS